MRIDLVREQGDALDGFLIYNESQYSFRFNVGSPVDVLERSGGVGSASLMVGTLQVEVGVETGVLLYAWGLHPRARWSESQLDRPAASPGVVRINDLSELQKGVGISVASVGEWSTVYDPTSGWLRIAPDSHQPDELRVTIANDTVLGLRDRDLNSV